MSDPEDALDAAYTHALALEKSGRREDAVRAWREVLALDPADHVGAAIRLAALGAAEAPAEMPQAYLRTLFDQQAERFDEVLVERLGYRVPWAMQRLLQRQDGVPFRKLLDLGCGTGLVGLALEPLAEHATGLDLSEGMLEMADARGVYDELYIGGAVEFLTAESAEGEGPWDLITAADVLPYLGPVEPLFEGVAHNLVPGGLWLFSTEALPDEDERDHAVQTTHRYAHSARYLGSALMAAGFVVETVEPVVVRHQEGAPVPGHLVLARCRRDRSAAE